MNIDVLRPRFWDFVEVTEDAECRSAWSAYQKKWKAARVD